MTTARRSILRILAITSLALGLAGCLTEAKKAEAPKPPRAVLVAPVNYEPVNQTVTLAATVRARVETDLGFRVGGKVARRLVGVGEMVATGRTLALLDDTDLKLQQEQAESELRAASTALQQAQSEIERVTSLRKRGWSTESTLEKQESAVGEARSRVQRATKAVELARNAFGYARLVAESDGVVTQALIEPGQVVAAGQGVFRIARLDEKEALVAVPEIMVERVKTGQATLTLWSAPDHAHSVTLRELAPAADAATRTYAARFTIADAGEDMRLGMSATVKIVDATSARIAKVPLAALSDSGKGPGLFVVDAGGGLTWKPIEVAGMDGRHIFVASGVAQGDLIVTLGVQKLDPGQKVRIVEKLEF